MAQFMSDQEVDSEEVDPVSVALWHLGRKDKTDLVFDALELGDAGMHLLSQELCKEEHAHFESLDLSDQVIGLEPARAFGEMLEKNIFLKQLAISSADISAEALAEIVHGVGQSKSLRHFILSHNMTLGPELVPVFTEMLQSNTVLETLDLSALMEQLNDVGPAVMDAALDGKTLQGLGFRAAAFNEAAMLRVVSSLARNASLRSLELSFNSLAGEAAKILVEVLRTDRVLEELILTGCCLLQDELDAILDVLSSKNKTLKTLSLGEHRWDNLGGLKKFLASKDVVLSNLDLEVNNLGDAGWQELLEELKVNCNITFLNVEFSGLTEKGLVYFADMLRVNSTLKKLIMLEEELPVDTELTGEGMLALANAVAKNTSLREFQWPLTLVSDINLCQELFMSNGSIVASSDEFEEICQRNQKMHAHAKSAAFAILMIRRRKDEKTLLHALPKELVQILAKLVWDTRTEVETWNSLLRGNEEANSSDAD